MSNRKKAKNRRLLARRSLNKTTVSANLDIDPEVLSLVGGDPDIPSDEKEVLKEVPAKDGDVVIGTAIIYDDGSVDVIIDPDAAPESVKKIHDLEQEMKYMGLRED